MTDSFYLFLSLWVRKMIMMICFDKRIGRGKCKWMWWRSLSSTSAGNGRPKSWNECALTQSTVFLAGAYPNLCTATWQGDRMKSPRRTRNGPELSTKDFNPASAAPSLSLLAHSMLCDGNWNKRNQCPSLLDHFEKKWNTADSIIVFDSFFLSLSIERIETEESFSSSFSGGYWDLPL